MRYPVWFPYPICWLKTIGSLIFAAIVIKLFELTGHNYLIIKKVLLYPGFFTKAQIIGLIISEIIFPSFIIGHIHQFLFGNPHPKLPRIIPHPNSLLEGFFFWIIPNGCVLFIGLILLLFKINPLLVALNEFIASCLALTTVFLMAYCYHGLFLIKRKFNPKKQLSR